MGESDYCTLKKKEINRIILNKDQSRDFQQVSNVLVIN